MPEYIEREELLKKAIKERRFVFQMEDLLNNEVIFKTVYKDLAEFINSIPAADVTPVRHGRWVLGTVEPGYLTPGGNRPWICSECKRVISWSLGRPYENFCPNCGAKMDLEVPNGNE